MYGPESENPLSVMVNLSTEGRTVILSLYRPYTVPYTRKDVDLTKSTTLYDPPRPGVPVDGQSSSGIDPAARSTRPQRLTYVSVLYTFRCQIESSG